MPVTTGIFRLCSKAAAAPKLVASLDLVATLMRGVVKASDAAGNLVLFEPPLPLGVVRFDLSWHRRNDVHPAQRWFRAFLNRYGGEARP